MTKYATRLQKPNMGVTFRAVILGLILISLTQRGKSVKLWVRDLRKIIEEQGETPMKAMVLDELCSLEENKTPSKAHDSWTYE